MDFASFIAELYFLCFNSFCIPSILLGVTKDFITKYDKKTIDEPMAAIIIM
jgi:hypothetical protein